MQSLMRRKPASLEALLAHQRLKPTLSWWHLIPLGVGAIVGTGIYTLIGVGANLAGPAVIVSFLIAGAVCACAALAYAEVAALIPASGSAYTYSYVVLGEIVAPSDFFRDLNCAVEIGRHHDFQILLVLCGRARSNFVEPFAGVAGACNFKFIERIEKAVMPARSGRWHEAAH